MSYGNQEFNTQYPSYDESDILDFITSGNGELISNDNTTFTSLDDAEDLDFNQFGTRFQTSSFSMNTSNGGVPQMQIQPIPPIQSRINGFGSSSNQPSSGVSIGFSAPSLSNLAFRQDNNGKSAHPMLPLKDEPITPGHQNPGADNLPQKTSVHAMPAYSGETEAIELVEFSSIDSDTFHNTLHDVQLSLQMMGTQLDDIRRNQTEILTNLCHSIASGMDNKNLITSLEQLIAYHQSSLGDIQTTLDTLRNIYASEILPPHEVERCNVFIDELNVITGVVQILHQECSLYLEWANGTGSDPKLSQLTGLIITKSSFPAIWMKRNQISETESIHVKLLTGCTVTITDVSDVRAVIDCHTTYQVKTTPPKPLIETDLSPMDPTSLTSQFQFTFKAGTRKEVAQCRFAITIQGTCLGSQVRLNNGQAVENNGVEETQLLSPESKLFMVITNECQYGQSFGILFQKDTFEYQWSEPRTEIPWPFFANSIQRYFIRSAKQDPSCPKRGLNFYDLAHIHQHFFNSEPLITLEPFFKFWDWFGKVLHRLRYQRHVASLWTDGLISGMISREGVVAQLINRPPGTFLLRFSESSAGFVAVGYRVSGANAGIKNYLVKTEDTNTPVTKTLPDFIRSRPEFSTILQYTGKHHPDGFPVISPIHKDYAMKNYCAIRPTKVADKTNGSPYDEL